MAEMRFGLRKLTLLDYPGVVACTVFTCGCNFRCPFCHNPDLVIGKAADLEFGFADVLEFLESRKKVLDGICITGGEPLLHDESVLLAQAAKAMGYRVKLDTNGSFPGKLGELLKYGVADYVAMDIKNSPEKYRETSGADFLEQVKQSVGLLMDGDVEYEFRTTVTGALHEPADFAAIGGWIAGAKRYFLQGFVDSGAILGGEAGRFEISDEKLNACLAEAKKFVPSAEIRGR